MGSFLIALLSSAVSPFLIRGLFWLIGKIRKKNEPYLNKTLLIEVGIEALFNLIVNALVLVIASVFFNAMDVGSSFAMYFSTSAVLSLLRVGSFIRPWIREKKPDKPKIVRASAWTVGLLVLLTADMFFCHGASRNIHNESLSVTPTSSYVITASGFTVDEEGYWSTKERSTYIIVNNLPKDCSTATFEFVPSNTQMELVIEKRNGSSWSRVKAYDINADYPKFCTVSLMSSETAYRFRFNLEATRSYNIHEYKLRNITFNVALPLDFVAARFWLVVGIAYVASCFPKFAKKASQAPTKAKAAKITLLAGVTAALAILLIVALVTPRGPESLLADYPIAKDKITDYDLYVKLFDAFKKGQLHLDVDPDPKLVALGMDAYIPSARSAVGASVLWDHAFFDGKYYSYFGAAPVILVSFPVHWVTGAAPTGLFLQFVAFILSVAAMFYLAIILTQVFSFKPNPLAYGMLVVFLCFAGMFFNLVCFRMTDFKYRVAVDYGLLGALLFLCFVLEAYRGYNAKLMLGFAGVSYVSIMGSRPDFGFWLIFVLPLLLYMLFTKKRAWKARILDFVPMAAVLLIGGGLLVAYNLIRFGSIAEFGQSYQMTAFDMRTFSLSINALPASVFHYWLQPPSTRDIFGYFATAFTNYSGDTHPYKGGTIGLFFNPATYLMGFAIATAVYEKRWHWKIAYILMPATLLFSSWSVYSLGGTCFRYMLVLYPLMTVVGLIGVARFISEPFHAHAKTVGYFVIGALCLSGAVLGANLLPEPFDGMRGEDMGGFFYYFIRDLFGARNY